jgi:cell wall-associated NlpC family hydrolase
MANDTALSALNSDLLSQIQNLGVQPSDTLTSALQSNDAVANLTSPYKFSDWASAKGYEYNYEQGTDTHSINGITIPNNIMNTLQGDYATPKVYENILTSYNDLLKQQQEQQQQQAITTTTGGEAAKSNLETGEYVSPYQQQLQEILDQLNQYTPYQTPEELEQYVYQLLQSANEPFTYDPSTDAALLSAQQEAGRQIREAAGAKGTLYSSATLTGAAKAKGALIPEYEQKAYSRFADQKNREVNMITTLMKWDEMQADRYNDQLDLIKTKFDYIMNLETQDFEKFQLMLEQRNFQKEYDLEMQALQLQREIQAIEEAYARVDALGYVDNEAAIVLGMPVGEKAGWVKQLELEHKQELARIKKEYENEKKLQKSQAKIEKELIAYKNKLEEATKKKLMAEQYKYDKKLAKYKGELALGGSIKGTAGIVAAAKSLKGLKYVYGGTSTTKGMDCSGFSQWVMKQNGVSIARTARDQAKQGKKVSRNSLQVGDLVFFDTISGNGRSVDHVGIYIGNNKMIHASSGSGKIIEVNMNTSYWNDRFTTARRFSTTKSYSGSSGSSGGGSSSGGSSGYNAVSSKYSTKAIQAILKDAGYYSGKLDNDYGPATTKAVKKFQKKYGLTQDGIVGKETMAMLITKASGYI